MQGAPSQWLPLTNCEIAELVGSNPQTVSPIIAKFCKQGLAARHRGGIEVLNPKGLQELAQDITVANLL
jgi:CRP-like cAMP-binding protein